MAIHNVHAVVPAAKPQLWLYPWSWSNYTADPARPAAVGDRPS